MLGVILLFIAFWVACVLCAKYNTWTAKTLVLNHLQDKVSLDEALVKSSVAFAYVYTLLPFAISSVILTMAEGKGVLEYLFLTYGVWKISKEGFFLYYTVKLDKKIVVRAVMETYKR